MNQNSFHLRKKAIWLLLFLLSYGLYFQNLGSRDFWEPDEPRFAEVVREMKLRKDYLFPTVNLQPYPNKPPLYYWLSALFSQGKVTEVSARLPSALAGLGTLIITYLLGSLFFHPSLALLATLALAVNGRFLWQSQYVQMDMVLTFFVLLAYYLFVLGWKRKTKLALLAGYGSTGLAVLAKGPLGLILIGLGVFSFLFFQEDTSQNLPKGKAFFLSLKKEFFQLHHMAGFLLFLVIALSWNLAFFFVAKNQHFWEYFWRQNFGRYFGTFKSHIRPFYFYFIQLPAEFLPWTLFLPACVYGLYQKRKSLPTEVYGLILWFGLAFFFFTLSQSKQGKYLLPLLPALHLIFAYGIYQIISEKEKIYLWLLSWPMKIFSILLIALSVTAIFCVSPIFPDLKSLGVVLSLFWVAMGMSLYYFSGRQKWLALYFSFFFLCGGTYLLGLPKILPYINRYKSAQPMARQIAQILEAYPNRKWAVYGIFRSSFIYYSQKFCTRMDATDVEKGLATQDYRLRMIKFLQKHPQAFVLTDSYHATQFPPKISQKKILILQRKVGKRLWKFYLFE